MLSSISVDSKRDSANGFVFVFMAMKLGIHNILYVFKLSVELEQ
jgi:hypothetical protein